MFESSWDGGDRLPDDDFDGVLERLLADAEVVPDYPPGEWPLDVPALPVGSCEPSGERQARLLDELARRRPTDKAPHSARWACVGSEYAPDEVGVALRLARGTACARIGLARRLLATLPDTHVLWESGLIDTSKARAIDDATVVLSDEHAGEVEGRVLPKAPEQTLAQLKAALVRAVLAVDPGSGMGRRGGIGGWW